MGTTESILSPEEAAPPPDGRTISHGNNERLQRQQGGGNLQQTSPRSTTRISRVDSLSGVLLGLPSSGKRTLLHRLQGRDPFTEHLELLPVHAQVIVPYQPPSTNKADRIRLQVQVPHSLKGKQVDFAVVMINPRHDPKHVGPYLENVLRSLLLQAGYTAPSSNNSDDEKNKAMNPFCLCLLLNFRDLKGSRDKITESDLKMAANNILEGYPDHVRQHIVLQSGTTSLLNCYGLGTLHRFIYQSYLQQKKALLERQLSHVQKELHSLNHEAKSQQHSYEDFLSLLQKPLQTSQSINSAASSSSQTQQQQQQQRVATKAVSKEPTKSRNLTIKTAAHHSDSSDSEVEEKKQRKPRKQSKRERRHVVMDPNHSPTHARKTTVPSYHEDPRSALEAFFADDDDTDLPTQSLSKKKRSDRIVTASSDSESEDDDFYYDEGGHRCGTHPEESESSSSEEEEKPTPVPSRAKAKRASMPSISDCAAEKQHANDTRDGDSDVVLKSQSLGKKEADANVKGDTSKAPMSPSGTSDGTSESPQPKTDPTKSPKQDAKAAKKRVPPVTSKADDERSDQSASLDDSIDEKKLEHVSNSDMEKSDSPRKHHTSQENSSNESDSLEDSPGVDREDTGRRTAHETQDDAADDTENSPHLADTSENKDQRGPKRSTERRPTKEPIHEKSEPDHNAVHSSRKGNELSSQPRASSRSDSINSDDEFIVEATHAVPESQETRNARTKDEAETKTGKDTEATAASAQMSGVSAEALAAIAVAQREAELMLRQENGYGAPDSLDNKDESKRHRTKKSKKKKKDESGDKREKKKKKKKDDPEKAEKKKKKRDKERRSRATEEVAG